MQPPVIAEAQRPAKSAHKYNQKSVAQSREDSKRRAGSRFSSNHKHSPLEGSEENEKDEPAPPEDDISEMEYEAIDFGDIVIPKKALPEKSAPPPLSEHPRQVKDLTEARFIREA